MPMLFPPLVLALEFQALDGDTIDGYLRELTASIILDYEREQDSSVSEKPRTRRANDCADISGHFRHPKKRRPVRNQGYGSIGFNAKMPFDQLTNLVTDSSTRVHKESKVEFAALRLCGG